MARALSLAVGIGAALAVASPARAGADEPSPWLGIQYEGETARITEVYPQSAAALAGLRPGDQITAIGHVPLGPGSDLGSLVRAHKIGARVPITLVRDGRVVRVAARLTVRPSDDELVYQNMIDQPLPAIELRDRLDAAVPVAERSRRPLVWMMFDARCDPCAAAAARLAQRMSHEQDQPGQAPPLRVVLFGSAAEVDAFLSRVPVTSPVWRIDREGESGRVGKRILGVLDMAHNGVVLVVDHRGLVRFATALSAGQAVYDGACAAVSRAAVEWQRDR